MKRKLAGIMAAILCCCLILNGIKTQAAEENDAGKISVDNISGKPGDTINIPVNLEKNPGIVALYISIEYDSSVLQLNNVTDTKLLSDYQAGDVKQNPFVISWEIASATENIKTTGVLANLNFTIVSDARPGEYAITVSEFGSSNIYDVDLQDVAFEFNAGTVTVDSPEHEHVYNGKTEVIKEADCTNDGLRRTYCSVNGCSEYEETIIKATGHTPGEWQTEKEENCTEEGIQIRNCTVCGVKIEEKSIPASGHKLGEWQIMKAATCIDTGMKAQYCTVCNEKVKEEIINPTGHSYGEWIIVTPPSINKEGSKMRTCSVCGNIEAQTIAAIIHGEKDHTFNGKQEVITEATCTKEGILRTYCSFEGCDTYQDEAIPAKGHTLGEWITEKEANCTDNGIKIQYCTVCNEKCGEEVIAALGHNYSDWKVVKEAAIGIEGEEERLCERCGHKETKVIPAIVHNEEDHRFDGELEVVKEPTCTTEGIQRVYCSFKGCDAYQENMIAATGHTMGEWTIAKRPTCTETGEKEAVCSVCQEVVTDDIAALGHTYGDWEVVKEATFHKDGLMIRVCEVCQDELTATIPKLSDSHTHDFSGDQVIIKEASCTEKGVAEIKCSNSECDAIKKVEIPALGHSYGEWKTVKTAEVGVEGIKERICTVCKEKEQAKIAALKDNSTKQNEKKENATTVKTGDNAFIMVWLIVLTTAGIIILIVAKKKSQS